MQLFFCFFVFWKIYTYVGIIKCIPFLGSFLLGLWYFTEYIIIFLLKNNVGPIMCVIIAPPKNGVGYGQLPSGGPARLPGEDRAFERYLKCIPQNDLSALL